jgi:3-phosphoshikimate 1-carboxyvinyltransferase
MASDEIEIIPAARPLAATVRPPGSKSLTNRAMLLAAMATGRSIISEALLSDDTQRMAIGLGTLGFVVHAYEAARRIVVEGRGGVVPATTANLDAGNAGTAMRFLSGFVTLGRGRYRLDGSPRMRQRPIGPLLEALSRLGVDVISENRGGCPPIIIDTTSAGFDGGEVTIDASLSSQFVSALLMPAPLWRAGLRLTVRGETAEPFIQMTLRLMQIWGADSSVEGDSITVPGGQRYTAMNFAVEPDATAASYFAAAAAVVGGTVRIDGLSEDSVQGDIGFFRILAAMGALVEWGSEGVSISGDGNLRGVEIAMNAMPDVVPTLAAIAPFASSPTRIRGVGFIRHHESDRISAVATELRRLGARVEEFDDGLAIEPSGLHPAAIETYDDHRIAMAFAVTGLKIPGVSIKNPACVNKTYPGFFRDLEQIIR